MDEWVDPCARWREVISAVLDGESPGVDVGEVESHVSSCEGCQSFRDFAHALRRGQMGVAPPMVDLAPRVTKAVAVSSNDLRWRVARGVLAVCAVEVIVFSIGDLLAADHDVRHLGAFSVAFGVALLAVVLRPTRARMMLPVAGVLAVALSISAVVDVFAGRVPLVSEARHVPEIVSVVMLWLLAAPVRRVDTATRGVRWVPRVAARHRDIA